MSQMSFSDMEYSYRKRTTKREEFLGKMEEIIPWDEWVEYIRPYYPDGKRGRPVKGIEKMLRMYLLQIWFNLSDEVVEDAIYDSYAMRKFMGINFMDEQVPDATTFHCKVDLFSVSLALKLNVYEGNNMAIGITTMTGMNYGSALQAYSLQKTFIKLGVESYTIRLRPRSYLLNFFRKYFSPNDEWNFRTRMWRLKSDIIYSPKSRLIKQFWTVNTSSHYYRSRRQLQKGEKSTRVLLAGSDQIWNPAYAPNYLYYLMFANQKALLYTYAVSLATDEIDDNTACFYQDRLRAFSSISVREKTGKVLLSKYTDNEIRVDLDPVFLLAKEYWDSFASSRFKGQNYIFLYMIKPNLKLCKEIKQVASHYNMEVYYIGDFSANGAGLTDTNNASVQDFLSLIKYSAAVVTNSFHATAFSILMNKQFFSYVPSLSGSRIIDILETFNLQGQIIDEKSLWECIGQLLSNNKKIEYSKVNPFIEQLREKSLEYLKQIAEVNKCT